MIEPASELDVQADAQLIDADHVTLAPGIAHGGSLFVFVRHAQ
jgi:hypothetical protein